MIINIPVKPLTKEGFAPYGNAIIIPTDGNPDRPTDRFNFWPKLSLYRCDSGVFQIGISTFFKRPFRLANMERHFKTEEFMTPLTGQIIIVFAPNKVVDGKDQPDFEKAEAFLINQTQSVVVGKNVWHWTPMPLQTEVSIICSFAEDTQKNDLDVQALPAGNVVQVTL